MDKFQIIDVIESKVTANIFEAVKLEISFRSDEYANRLLLYKQISPGSLEEFYVSCVLSTLDTKAGVDTFFRGIQRNNLSMYSICQFQEFVNTYIDDKYLLNLVGSKKITSVYQLFEPDFKNYEAEFVFRTEYEVYWLYWDFSD